MSDQDYATVSGTKVHRSDFAYAPPGSEPSEWKLPIHDESHVRNALARFNQTELPAEAKAAAKRKILERAHKYGIDTSGFEHASEGRLTNIFSRSLRLALSQPVIRDGRSLYQIPVCVTGCWHKGSRKFSITKDTLAAMERNFAKRKNETLVIDYEHASEMPEVARGGPVPAAGWIHELTIDDFRLPIQGGQSSIDNRQSSILDALVEWTPQAEEMIRTGQYRFFSPAIDWDAKDKESGEPQGATMTSGALTNHPFLEELPAITLSDHELSDSATPSPPALLPQGGEGRSTWMVWFADSTNQYLDAPIPHPRPLSQRERGDRGAVGEGENPGGNDMAEEKKAKEVTMKKITDGEHAGHHHIFAGGETVGCMSEKELAQHAAKHFSDLLEHDAFKNGARKHFGAGDKETMTELGVPDTAEAKRLIDLGRATEAADLAAKSRQVLLSEAVKDGKIDGKAAQQLARSNKITFADYIAAQEAERAIDEAVRAGKILPRERAFFFRDALERPDEFTELVKGMPPRVNLSTVGLGSAEAVSVDEEVSAETRRLMSEKNLGYAAALKEVLRANPQLAQNYHKEHSRQIGGDSAAN